MISKQWKKKINNTKLLNSMNWEQRKSVEENKKKIRVQQVKERGHLILVWKVISGEYVM